MSKLIGIRNRRRMVLVSMMTVVALSLSTSAEAHMIISFCCPIVVAHVGYWPGTQERSMVLYNETGSQAWNDAGYRWAVTHYNYWNFWWVGLGVPVPYVDYQTQGGAPGCGNTANGADICIGDPDPGHAAEAHWSWDSNQHIVAPSWVELRDGYNDRQKEAIICQEVSHIMGLDHNTHAGSSSDNTCMWPTLTSYPHIAWNEHDDVTFRDFYSGHQP